MARHFLGSLALIGVVAANAAVDVETDSDYADAFSGVEFIEDLVAEASADWTEATADALELNEALKVVEDVDQLELAELPPKNLSPEMLAALAKLTQKAQEPVDSKHPYPYQGAGFRIPKPMNSKQTAAPSPEKRKVEEAVSKEIMGAIMKGAAKSAGGGSLDGLMKIGNLLGAKGGAGARPAAGLPAGAKAGDLEKLKALGKMFGGKVGAGARPAAGGAGGADKLKALGKMLGSQGGAAAAPAGADKLKALGKLLGSQGGAGAAPAGGSANAFLKKHAKSAAEMGPAEQQAALKKVNASVGPAEAQALQKMADNVMASTAQKITQAIQSAAAASTNSPLGDGAKKIQEKLAQVITDEPEAGAVAQLEAVVNKVPNEALISQLTKMKTFLETSVATDPKYNGLRSLIAGPNGVMRLAKFSEAATEAMSGFKANGPMWGTTDAGFAATARLVQAAQATDGREHEAFSASGALALKKYFQGHPDEAKSAFRGLMAR